MSGKLYLGIFILSTNYYICMKAVVLKIFLMKSVWQIKLTFDLIFYGLNKTDIGLFMLRYLNCDIVCIRVPLKSAKCPIPSFLGNFLLCIGFLYPPSALCFSSLTPSYILIIKFLVKVSQFEFFVMTEKNIFVYELFCH